jgi:hypothetical protein
MLCSAGEGSQLTRHERDREATDISVHGSLKLLVTRLSEAELLQIRGWIEREIPRARGKGLRLLRVPTTADLGAFDGSPAELTGQIRRRLHELPEDSLLLLHGWVLEQLTAVRAPR